MSLRDQFHRRPENLHEGRRPAPAPPRFAWCIAKVKDADIAARPKGITAISDDEVMSSLRGMIKSRRESVDLYRQGNRPELAAKEEAEIAVIEGFLPQQMDDAALAAAVDKADRRQPAPPPPRRWAKSWPRSNRRTHGGALDMSRVTPLVKARLTAIAPWPCRQTSSTNSAPARRSPR